MFCTLRDTRWSCRLVILCFIVMFARSARAEGWRVGAARCVTPGHAAHLPLFSPDGRALAVSCEAFAGLAVVDRDAARWRVLGDAPGVAYRAVWAPRGDALWVRVRGAGDRVGVEEWRLDGAHRALGGDSYALAHDGAAATLTRAGWDVPADAGAAWALTADGAYAVGATRAGEGFVLDTATGARRAWPGAGVLYGPVAAPRGHRVVASRLGAGLVLLDLDAWTERALGEGTSPCWLPDGSGVVCEVTRDDGHEVTASSLVVVHCDTAAARETLDVAPAWRAQHPAVSPDGAWLAFDTPFAGVFVAPLTREGGAR